MQQNIITAESHYWGLDRWIRDNKINRLLLVCDNSIKFMDELVSHLKAIEKMGVEIIRFTEFQPNPLYENVVNGVRVFRRQKCDAVMAVGGGSAMDVAKCIKFYSSFSGDGTDGEWLMSAIVQNAIPFLAMPTTAGTGSEATRFAVIYYEGEKQSITSESFIPQTVLLDPSALKTLPIYQKKSTMLDAFCHAIESFWSINSTDESKEYSRKAIELVVKHKDGYLSNNEEGNAGMLLAANMAGRAINITQTTAGHAMCYKITSLYKLAHGHAAALCNRVLFPWMLRNLDKCIEPRGKEYLNSVFVEISKAMGCKSTIEAEKKLDTFFYELELEIPTATEAEYALLKKSVNPLRLKNHPIQLDPDTIDSLYHLILK